MLCQNCGKRPGTEKWVGTGGVIGLIHGCYQMWCERCCIEAQLEHARKAARSVRKLERRLAELDKVLP